MCPQNKTTKVTLGLLAELISNEQKHQSLFEERLRNHPEKKK